MNAVSRYFYRRMLTRVLRETRIYGSCHTHASPRHRWNPLRYVFGPFKYKFLHPEDVACRCDWEDCGNIKNPELARR